MQVVLLKLADQLFALCHRCPTVQHEPRRPKDVTEECGERLCRLPGIG